MYGWITRHRQILQNENTAAACCNNLTRFVDFQAGFQGAAISRADRLADVTPHHFQAFRCLLQERGHTGTSCTRKIAAIKAFYRCLMAKGEAREKANPPLLSPDKAADLLEAPDRPVSRHHRRDKTVLNRDDTVAGGSYLQVPNRDRRPAVHLADSTHQAPMAYPDERLHDGTARAPALFLNHQGIRLTRQGFRTILKHWPHTQIRCPVTLEMLQHSRIAHTTAARTNNQVRIQIYRLSGAVS